MKYPVFIALLLFIFASCSKELSFKNETIKKDSSENMINELLEKNLLSKEEIEKMLEAHALKQEVISVDSFEANEYRNLR